MADEIQEVIRIVTKDLKKLDAVIQKNKDFADSADKANKKSKKATTGLNDLTKSAGNLAAAFASVQTLKFAKELGELGAKSQTARKNFKAFSENAGKDMTKSMSAMRAATMGMISDMELQQLAMQSMLSGVSFDDMITAMKFVSKQATATGANVSQKMQTVMTGFARGSAMFLDDVGIQVMGAKDVVGAAVDQMNQKMAIFGDTSEDASVSIGKSRANIENIKRDIGEHLIPATEEWWKALEKGAKATSKILDNLKLAIEGEDTAFAAAENVRMSHMKRESILRKIRKLGVEDQLKKELEQYDLINDRIRKLKGQREDLRTKATRNDVEKIKGLQQEINEEYSKRGATQRRLEHLTQGEVKSMEQYKQILTSVAFLEKERAKAPEKQKVDLSTGGMSDDEKAIAQMRVDAQKKFDLELWQWREDQQTQVIKKREANEEASRQLESQRIVAFNDQVIADAQRMEQLIGEIKEEQRQKDIAAELEKRQMFMDSANMMVSGINKLSSSKQMALQKEAQAEIKAIQMSTKSEKQKAKEISKVNKQLEDDQKKAANVAWAATSALGAAKASLAIIDMIQRFPSFTPAGKIAAGAVIGGVAFSQVANIVASKPKFYNGGDVPFNGRNDDSQMALVRSGEKILNPVEARRYNAGVTNNTNNNGNSYNINVSVQGGGSNQELTAMLTTALPEVLERGVKTGDIDLGRMGIVTA